MKSYIYVVKSKNSNKIYIGGTSRNINNRLSELKTSFKNYIHNKIGNYSRAFDVLCHGDNYVELLHEFECDTIAERNRIEGMFIREYQMRNRGNIVNNNMAGGSIGSYYYNKINNLN